MSRKQKNPGSYVVPATPMSPAMVVSKSGHVFIHTAEHAACELCGKKDELRPYGPGGKNVCFDCAMKDEKEAKRQFGKQFEQ